MMSILLLKNLTVRAEKSRNDLKTISIEMLSFG